MSKAISYARAECKICYDDGATYRVEQRQALCDHCAKDTAPKVGRGEFDAIYWGENAHTVDLRTRREFYSDYLASKDDVSSYIVAIRAPIARQL